MSAEPSREQLDYSLGSREANEPSSPVARFGPDEPLHLDAGRDLSPFQIAYNTYGTLNADKSNAILVCHALTGDHYPASRSPVRSLFGRHRAIHQRIMPAAS